MLTFYSCVYDIKLNFPFVWVKANYTTFLQKVNSHALMSALKCLKCNLFTHGTPGVLKNSFEMSVHSRIELGFGNVAF